MLSLLPLSLPLEAPCWAKLRLSLNLLSSFTWSTQRRSNFGGCLTRLTYQLFQASCTFISVTLILYLNPFFPNVQIKLLLLLLNSSLVRQVGFVLNNTKSQMIIQTLLDIAVFSRLNELSSCCRLRDCQKTKQMTK